MRRAAVRVGPAAAHRVVRRDRGGLDLLHDRYSTLLKALSMKVLHNDADAEDLVQDVFIEIWDRAASYDSQKGRPLSWT